MLPGEIRTGDSKRTHKQQLITGMDMNSMNLSELLQPSSPSTYPREGRMTSTIRKMLFHLGTIIAVLSLLPVMQASARPLSSISQVFRSVGIKDGWVLESGEFTNVGGSASATGPLIVGDDSRNRQYRAILHFNTAVIPDTATITSVKLKIKRQGVVGTNPFTTHGALRFDMRKGFFGAADTVAAADFQAAATKYNAGQFSSVPVSGGSAYQATLPASSFQFINKTGSTEFRLRFALDDNNDLSADFIRFLSGDYPVVSDRPELEVQYTP